MSVYRTIGPLVLIFDQNIGYVYKLDGYAGVDLFLLQNIDCG